MLVTLPRSLMDRITGVRPTDVGFRSNRLVARQASMMLVQRFAEERAAARVADAGSTNRG